MKAESCFLMLCNGLLLFLSIFATLELVQRDRLLNASAEKVIATIVDRRRKKTSENIIYQIDVAYEYAAGLDQLTETISISYKHYQQVKVGDLIEIMVATADPTVITLATNYPPSRFHLYLFSSFCLIFIWAGYLIISGSPKQS